MTRAQVLGQVAALLPSHGDSCVLIGVDGVDGAGKTTFADELAVHVSRPTVRISVDDFHNVSALRYRLGRDSAEGFWLDAFNYPRLIADVLEPLRASRRYRPRAHDLASDAIVDEGWRTAPRDAVVIIDGLFLLRPQLSGRFDLVIFVDVPFRIAAERLARRDGARPMERYVGASRRYLASCDPKSCADVLIDNSDLENPRLLRFQPQ